MLLIVPLYKIFFGVRLVLKELNDISETDNIFSVIQFTYDNNGKTKRE